MHAGLIALGHKTLLQVNGYSILLTAVVLVPCEGYNLRVNGMVLQLLFSVSQMLCVYTDLSAAC